ncbi:peptidase, M50 family [Hyphomonas neptunium ATCC 15444]|uniref:Peptidase, M50 family n=2 Tax=Hyphomonas TaxID=85 RepID=Q0C1B4_HYPNA|nr:MULTISPECIES: M50 family metallopeptidase [Hyphomonas]ABI78432.1 peptidase, M50 family [Hyphomonas neptunium ATCC 15444]KCZ95108.1 M50 family peptidase [Hyphomonas hirschiana VP5]
MDQILSQGPLFLFCLIFMMGIVVVIHEFGHYLAARLYGVAIESFSVGFGKPLFERRDRRGTRWRVNWIPLGGFVSFLPASAKADDETAQGIAGISFDELKPIPKIVVSLAGPFANFVLATLIFALAYGVFGSPKFEVQITHIGEGMPAEEAGLLPGDIIREINGRPILTGADATMMVLVSPNKAMRFNVDRNGQELNLDVIPREIVRPNEFGQVVPQSTAGFSLVHSKFIERVTYGPIGSLVEGTAQTGRTIDQTVKMLSRIATGNMSVHAMSGPVGVGDISRRAVNRVMEQTQLTSWQKTEQLFWMLMSVCAAVSVGVGFFNLLPLPVLDGGRVVFHAYEAFTGSKMPSQVEAFALRASVFLLLLMVVVITWGDVIETGVFGRGGG